jgi:hypothetical protein
VAWTKALCTSSATAQSTGGSTEYVSGTGVSSVGKFCFFYLLFKYDIQKFSFFSDL